jgi:hypothetical protein
VFLRSRGAAAEFVREWCKKKAQRIFYADYLRTLGVSACCTLRVQRHTESRTQPELDDVRRYLDIETIPG